MKKFTKQEQEIIDMIEAIADCSADFAYYSNENYEVYLMLKEELSTAKKALFDYVKELLKK